MPGTPGTNKNLNTQKNNFMKRTIIFTALLLALSTTYSFATPTGEINWEIKTSFRHDFQNAQLMNTEIRDNFTKLTFKMNEVIMTAFYSEKGELMAVTRNIVSNELPLGLLLNLKKHYSASWISDLFEFSDDSQTCYYVTVENADSKMTLRSNGDSWEVYSNTKK
jgi:hypothetical protein